MLDAMSRVIKLTAMFLPLLLLLCGVGLVTYDLKHPLAVKRDDCRVLATGTDAGSFKTVYNRLFDQGAESLYDIGLDCRQLGIVIVNDKSPFHYGEVATGYLATVTHKTYRYWPDIWRINIQEP